MINYDWLILDGILDDFDTSGWIFVCDGDAKGAMPDWEEKE